MPNLSAAMAAREDDAALVQITELAICAAKHALNGIFFGFDVIETHGPRLPGPLSLPGHTKKHSSGMVDDRNVFGSYMRHARNG